MRGRPIPGLKDYQGPNPKRLFDLPWPVKQRAYQWVHHLLTKGNRERGYVAPWLFAIYVGQAKRLALNPPTSEWGRSMLGKRGGKAVQHLYRMEGRHPTENATHVGLADLKVRKEAERRKRLGLPPASRHGFTLASRYEP